MIISFTGHRPPKIGGYKMPNPTYNFILKQTKELLLNLKPEKCISGMAIGFDQIAADLCYKLKIPFIAAVPFPNQESKWNEDSQKIYKKLLERAAEVVIVSPGPYQPALMQIRNEWLVDHCDELIACFDGSSGGTKNCIDYALKQNKIIHVINPGDFDK